jgi:plastocyanin
MFPLRSYFPALVFVCALGACGSSSGSGGTGGGDGGQSSGTGGTSGGTGGSSGAFQAIAPCTNQGDYAAGSAVTFPNADNSYSPRCLKIAAGDRVSFMATAGTFEMHNLEPSRSRGNTADSPIFPRSGAEMSTSFTFEIPGLYAYYCSNHGNDSTGAVEAGVVWVE